MMKPNTIAVNIVEMIKTRVKPKGMYGEEVDTKYLSIVEPRIIKILQDTNYFCNPRFDKIIFCFKYGIENLRIEPGNISKEYNRLAATIELKYDWVEYYAWNDEAGMERLVESALLYALIKIGKKYKLPTQKLEERYEEIGGFPEIPEGYEKKLPPSANRPPAEEVAEILESRKKRKVRLL